MSNRFRSRVALISANREHIRYVPRAYASRLIASGSAVAVERPGRVREVQLVSSVAAFAERIGPPTGACLTGVRFHRWTTLERARVVEHHPRATDYES